MNKHLSPELLTIAPIKSAEQFIAILGTKCPWHDDKVMNRAEVIEAVSAGEFSVGTGRAFNHLLSKIVAYSLEAGTCRDATADITGTVFERWAQDGKLLTEEQKEFVALCKGEAFANAFRTEAT